MAYFFVNTDAKSLGGESPHDRWMELGYAFAGGPIRFGQKFARMVAGDECLMYANRIGLVAVGRVLEPWDAKEHSDPLVYREPYRDTEYRLRVDWHTDLRRNPIRPGELTEALGSNPVQSVQMVRRHDDRLRALIHAHGER